MLRVTSFFLFLSAVSARDFASDVELQRKMQDFDLDVFQFNFGGVNINADVAQQQCPDQWSNMVGCVIRDCPTFTEDCPDFSEAIPDDYLGTAAPEAPPAAGNATAGGDEPELMGNGTMVTADEFEVPTCEEIDELFCASFGGAALEGCCMTECTAEIQQLIVCITEKTTGEDRSDCEVPVCPTTAPAVTDETPAGTTDAPASGAVSAKPVAATVAALFAFAML